MGQILKGDNVIGAAVKWTPGCEPDRYEAGRGDPGVVAGTQHYPQGENGPLFVKKQDGTWKHIAGGAASLTQLANGERLTGVGPKIGTPR